MPTEYAAVRHMGTNSEIRNEVSGMAPFFRAGEVNRPTSFMVQWRALQHELKTTRLNLLTGISQIVAMPRKISDRVRGTSPQFRKSLLSNSIAS